MNVDRLNKAAGVATHPYADGKPQAGCYYIGTAYGGYRLQRMSLEVGCTGITLPLGSAYITRRALTKLMEAL